MWHSRLSGVMFLVATGWSLSASGVETIARRHDRPISGDVTAVSKTEVTVRVRNPREETITIPANEVENISWSGEPPETNLARSDETGGRFQKAIEGYEKSLSASKATNPLARVELEYSIIRATAKLALADADKADAAIKKLEDFRAKQSDHYRDYDAVQLLGRLYLAKKDYGKARQMFDLLGKAPWKDVRASARIANARILAAEDKSDEALAAFDAIIGSAGEGPEAEALQQEASLGKARVLLSQRKFDEARKLLEDVIKDPDDHNDPRTNAEAWLRLGDCLREQGKDKEALLAYLHLDVPLFPVDKVYRAEALYHLTRLWDRTGYKARSIEARERLESDEFKGTEWARQLKAPSGE